MNTIDSPANETVKQTAALFKSAAARREQGLFVAEGLKLAQEAAQTTGIETLWVSTELAEQNEAALTPIMAAAKDVVFMGERVVKKLSDQKTPQGVVAVCRLPALLEPEAFSSSRRVAALCSLRDPLNVGAAMRSAAAFGYDVLLSADCADCYSPKALRSAMGASLHCRVAQTQDMPGAIEMLGARGLLTLGAVLDGGAVAMERIDISQPLLVAVGNESAGLALEIAARCREKVIIEQKNAAVDSLNAAVAAGILLYGLRDREAGL